MYQLHTGTTTLAQSTNGRERVHRPVQELPKQGFMYALRARISDFAITLANPLIETYTVVTYTVIVTQTWVQHPTSSMVVAIDHTSC